MSKRSRDLKPDVAFGNSSLILRVLYFQNMNDFYKQVKGTHFYDIFKFDFEDMTHVHNE